MTATKSSANSLGARPPLLTTVRETAAQLRISKTTFYGLLSAGQIGPCPVRLGRRVLFRRAEVEAWVSAGCPP